MTESTADGPIEEPAQDQPAEPGSVEESLRDTIQEPAQGPPAGDEAHDPPGDPAQERIENQPLATTFDDADTDVDADEDAVTDAAPGDAVPLLVPGGFPAPWPDASYADDGFGDDTWFHQSNATESDWRDWKIGDNAGGPDVDLGRVYVATSSAGTLGSSAADTIVKIAFNRWANNGTLSFRVELNQVRNTDIVPIRTAGDVMFLFSQKGGDIPTLAGGYEWTGSSWRLLAAGLDAFLVSRHSQTISELEVNLTALFAAQTGGNVCTGGYVVANIRTAAQDAFDAQLKDWVAPVNLATPATCEATVEVTKLVQPWDADTATPAGGWTFTASGATERFGLASHGTAVTGADGVATAGAARSFVLRASDPVAEGTLTVAEDLPAGWTMVSATCESTEPTVDLSAGSFTLSGIRIDDAIACTVVNKAPQPLGASATLEGSFVREYGWDVEKSVDMSGAFEKARPGDGHEFTYVVAVSAEQQADTGFVATSQVTIENPSSVSRSLAGVEILLGGRPPTSITADGGPVTLDSSTVIEPKSDLVLDVTWELGSDPGPVALTMAIPDGGTFVAPDGIVRWESDERVGMETRHGTASLTDDYPELAQQWDAIVTALGAPGRRMDALDAVDHLGEGVGYTYTAVRGEQVEPGECEVFGNVATVTPSDGDGDGSSDDTQSKVCVGVDLGIGKGIVYDVQRTVLWDVSKSVDGETTVPAVRVDGELVADVDYVVHVAPTVTDSAWQISGTVTVTNPNPWQVQARLAEAPELGDAVTRCWFVDPEDVDSRRSVLDVLLPAAGGDPGSAGEPAELELGYACQVEGRPDELDGRNIAVLEWESGQDPTVQDAAWSANGSATATADLADVTPGFSYLNTDVTVYDDQTVAGQVVELGTSNWLEGPYEFRYTVRVPGPQIPDTEVTHVNRAWLGEVPAEGDAEVTVVAYDLALRVWVSEVWRDGVQVFERDSDPSNPGADQVIPHVTFDDDDIDIQVGDLVVHDIHLFNQGTRTARVDELTNHSTIGLDLVGDEWMALIPGHDNDHWEYSPDGEQLLMSMPGGIVLAPGGEAEVHLTLRVTEDALTGDADAEETDHFTFTEISAFSGWVPQEVEPEPAASMSLGAFAEPGPAVLRVARSLVMAASSAVTHDGTAGFWSDSVVDIDSTPGRENVGTDDDNVTLAYHSWEDNEIHESNTSMLVDDDENDYDNDEDDHDGEIVRVVPASRTIDRDPPVTPVSAPGGQLPVTGAALGGLLLAAVMLAGLGAMLVRRRRVDEG